MTVTHNEKKAIKSATYVASGENTEANLIGGQFHTAKLRECKCNQCEQSSPSKVLLSKQKNSAMWQLVRAQQV